MPIGHNNDLYQVFCDEFLVSVKVILYFHTRKFIYKVVDFLHSLSALYN